MFLVKKKKKKKKGVSIFCEEYVEFEIMLFVRWIEKLFSFRKQVFGYLEFFSGEKKNKKLFLVMFYVFGVKIFLDFRQGEEEIRVGKKFKKYKKEKKGVQDFIVFLVQDFWFCEVREVRDVGDICLVGKKDEEQVVLGQKWKWKSFREYNGKVKKKKKIYQEGDVFLGYFKFFRFMESSFRKGSKKKLVKVEVLEYIFISDDFKVFVKKKMKFKKKVEQLVIEELVLKRKKKKKRKESGVVGDFWKEEIDMDLEVVLEKKGNMDEVYIDQVR